MKSFVDHCEMIHTLLRTERKRGVEGKTARLTPFGADIGTWTSLEIFVVTLPITIEMQFPNSRGLEADDFRVVSQKLAEVVSRVMAHSCLPCIIRISAY